MFSNKKKETKWWKKQKIIRQLLVKQNPLKKNLIKSILIGGDVAE